MFLVVSFSLVLVVLLLILSLIFILLSYLLKQQNKKVYNIKVGDLVSFNISGSYKTQGIVTKVNNTTFEVDKVSVPKMLISKKIINE